MGTSIAYLQKHPRTGRLSYRRPYPIELRAHIPPPNVELKRSLQAAAITEPGAFERFQLAADEFERIVAHARKLHGGAVDTLDEPTIAYLAKIFERDQAEGIEQSLLQGGEDFAARALEGIWWTEDDFLAWRVDDDRQEMIAFWGSAANALLHANGMILSPDDSDGLGLLCRALNDVAIRTRMETKGRLKGEVIEIPALPAPLSAASRAKGAGLSSANPAPESFETIAERVLESLTQNTGASTKQSSRTALRSFREAHGPLQPSEITKAVVTDWLNLLAKRPAKPDAKHRTLPLRKLVGLYEGKKVAWLSKKTRAGHLGALSALWNKAQNEEGYIPEGLANPFVGRKSLSGSTQQKVRGFSPAELGAIFSLPVFTAGERPLGGKGDASYWIPLLLFWTGARPEEIAQLMVDDVSQGLAGRWQLRITDEGVHPYKGQRTIKAEKNGIGRRTFPIPQPLLALNFLAYVASIRASGETALFPRLRTKGARGDIYAGWGGWWCLYVRQHNALPKGGGRQPAREFRHTWTTAARQSRIPEDAREYIQGHRRSGASSNDVYGDKASLGLYVDQLDFQDLDLSMVRPWAVTTT